jgi:MOSC domain-containing protein YiiM
MMTGGHLIGIHVCAHAGERLQSLSQVRVIPGRGLAGDRYAAGLGTFSDRPGKRDVTLIESEVLENYQLETGKELTAAESRRNLLTRGIRLNALVDHEFQVGRVRMRGLRLSEPCTHLMRLTHPETLCGLAHRGGLIAEILSEGEIAVGDRISQPTE